MSHLSKHPKLRFPVGTYVHVSNGTRPPPARFKRQYQQWSWENYEGVIVERDDEHGTYTVQPKPENGWCKSSIVIRRSGVPASTVSAALNMPLVHVTNAATVVPESATAALYERQKAFAAACALEEA